MAVLHSVVMVLVVVGRQLIDLAYVNILHLDIAYFTCTHLKKVIRSKVEVL